MDVLQLVRLPLSAAVSASALAGFLLSPLGEGPPPLGAVGVFLLAAGSSALNQAQERGTDSLMERTRHRPLPAGRLSLRNALALSLVLLVAGTASLAAHGWVPATLGLSAVLLYNGIYTPMKKRTAFAILPGALCGALPPAIGWTAAGGSLSDPRIVLLAGLFFLWQIPHFWGLALRWQDDYRRAGFPTVNALFSRRQGRRVLVIWLFSLGTGSLAYLLFALPGLPGRILGGAALAALGVAASLELGRPTDSLPRLPLQANMFMAAFIFALLADRFLS